MPAKRKCTPREKELDRARGCIESITRCIKDGHPERTEWLIEWFALHPELKSEYRGFDALAVKAQNAWAKAVSFGDPIAELGAQEEARAITDELLGSDRSVLNRLLVSAVVVATLAHTRAAHMAATSAGQLAVQLAREQTLCQAQKRLAHAIKSWKLLADKKAQGVQPLVDLDPVTQQEPRQDTC